MRPSRNAFRLNVGTIPASLVLSFSISSSDGVTCTIHATGPLPYGWQVQHSANGTSGWTEEYELPGTSTSWVMNEPLMFYRIQPSTAPDNPYLTPSNVVQRTGLDTEPATTDAGSGTIAWTWTGAEPDHWEVFVGDSENPYQFDQGSAESDARNFQTAGGSYQYVVVGMDSNGSPITAPSTPLQLA